MHSSPTRYIPNPYFRKGAPYGQAARAVAKIRNTRVKLTADRPDRCLLPALQPCAAVLQQRSAAKRLAAWHLCVSTPLPDTAGTWT